MLGIAERPSALRSPPWPEQGEWTLADWERLPDDGYRYELIGGELFVSPPPAVPHQNASGNLFLRMASHAAAHALGKVYCAPIGVMLPPKRNAVQPDIIFVSKRREKIIGLKYIEGVPDLIVEIVSPSNWSVDRQEKFKLYAKAGVKEYWIVDYRPKTIEVFLLHKGEYALQGKFSVGQKVRAALLKGFEVKVEEVFTR